MNQKIENLKGKLIVSCQALPAEPLHSSFIMGRMALAAKIGGAAGIRANTAEDIREIQKQVDLPIIGIVKRDYDDSRVYITPTEISIRRRRRSDLYGRNRPADRHSGTWNCQYLLCGKPGDGDSRRRYHGTGIVRPAAAGKGSDAVFDSTGVEKYEDLHGRI